MIVCALVYLACVGHARRLQSSTAQVRGAPSASDQAGSNVRLSEHQSIDQGNAKGKFKTLTALKALLLDNPGASFNPCSLRAALPRVPVDGHRTTTVFRARIGQPCVAQTTEAVIGVSLVAGSAVKGIPQIVKILKAKSVTGLSLNTFYGDLLVFLGKVVYHTRKAYPLSAWGELLLLLGQNIIFVFLYHCFGKAGFLRPFFGKRADTPGKLFFGVTDVAILGLVAFALFCVLPHRLLPVLSASTAPLIFCSYAAQILTNFRRRSTGQLAVLTVFLRWLFSLVRVGTTITQLGGDLAVLMNHALGAAGCSILLLQIYFYSPERSKRKAGKAEALQGTPESSGGLDLISGAFVWRSLGGFGNEEFSEGSRPKDKVLRAAFDKLDKDGTGRISRDELLEEITRSYAGRKSAEDLAQLMITTADEDGDGYIDFDEFCNVLRGEDGIFDEI